LMPSLDLALGLRMQRCAADMAHAVGIDPLGKLGGDVTGCPCRKPNPAGETGLIISQAVRFRSQFIDSIVGFTLLACG
jgi:hypothetical protein